MILIIIIINNAKKTLFVSAVTVTIAPAGKRMAEQYAIAFIIVFGGLPFFQEPSRLSRSR